MEPSSPPGGGIVGTGVALIVGAILVLAAVVSAITEAGGCDLPVERDASPSTTATRRIPAGYLALYQRAGTAYRVPWTVLAAIGAIESDHGRSQLPGVSSNVNAFGCCAGPMQFNIRNGPPSTWQAHRIDGDRDGDTNVYDPADAIASAANYVKALLEHTASVSPASASAAAAAGTGALGISPRATRAKPPARMRAAGPSGRDVTISPAQPSAGCVCEP